MPHIDYNFLISLKDDFNKYKTFIETGTAMGWTIFSMEPYFDNLFTIEISELYYTLTKDKYNGNKINFILGDSTYMLNDILGKIDNDTIIFLDGHFSSGNTGKGDKDCPLLEELESINNNFKHNAIIIIDDHRLFGKGPNNKQCSEDWEDISDDKVLNILSNRITDTYFLPSELDDKDRMIIHIKNI